MLKIFEGNYIIDGKTVTGFSNSEEQAVGLADVVPYLTEDELKIVVQTMNKVITGLSSVAVPMHYYWPKSTIW